MAAHTDDRLDRTHRAVVGHTDKAVELAAHDSWSHTTARQVLRSGPETRRVSPHGGDLKTGWSTQLPANACPRIPSGSIPERRRPEYPRKRRSALIGVVVCLMFRGVR